jgi:uncharacterized protein (DUF302 family)
MLEGIITTSSAHSVPDTLDRLEQILRSHGINIFARIDHAGEAEKVGLHMPLTQLLIFGNPKSGTPIMLANPLTAIELPLKALAWQDPKGKTFLSYNDPNYMQRRFSLAHDLFVPLIQLGTLMDQATR